VRDDLSGIRLISTLALRMVTLHVNPYKQEVELTVSMCCSMAAATLEAASWLSPASIVSVLISVFELKVRSFSSEAYSETNSFKACWSILDLCQAGNNEA